jgi:hypothetical protein
VPMRKHTPAQWPFWLLVAAWFCANSPQAITFTVLGWMAEARHFTHQQKLTAEVAFLLAGEQREARVHEADTLPAKPFAPPVPTDATMKKIELAVHRTSEVLPPALRAMRRVVRSILLPDTLRAAPPHEPPRARLVIA